MSNPSVEHLALVVRLQGLALRELMRALSISQARQCSAGLQASALDLLATVDPLDAAAEERFNVELSALKAALQRGR
ncbi:hypothetical protein [Ideonella sp. A 288]|uniref:hypothetical protein n=1 Tax=Ideonella sp. A 288 TaxID=1962181 RepID=UPI000B4AEB72|nr:hypothetical protein [Ideonella sp. A 288]